MSRFPIGPGMLLSLLAFAVTVAPGPAADETPRAKLGDLKTFAGPNGLKVMVRVMLPQEQETELLFLCFFKHKPQGDTVLSTIQKFDDRMGGLIASLRNRGEFAGEELETMLINPPAGSLKAKRLMLIGLGEEDKLSLKTMYKIGGVALREAARLGVKSAAFGAAIRDQGNSKYGTGDVGKEVVEGALLAFDTEKRMQKEGIGAGVALEEWIYLAGPEYFHDVHPKVSEAVTEAAAILKTRSHEPYSKSK